MSDAPGDIARERPPYGAAALTGCGVLLLYVLTLAPTTAWWDASEYIATAHILGIPHPPGNPLFVVLGRAWSVLLAPFGMPVAVRVNLLAAATSAAASGFFFYLVAHRVLATLFDDRRFALLGAAASSLLGATTFTVWSQSNVNEKVYTLSVLIVAAVSWLAVRWKDRREEPEGARYLLAALYLMVLGTTNHMMSALPAPALVVFVLMTDWRYVLRTHFLARAIPLIIVGLSFNFVLPVRAELDPVINEGDPTCESLASAAVSIYSGGRAGCEMLSQNLTRAQYQPVPVTVRKAPFGDQFEMYFQYFDWQWSRGLNPSEHAGTVRLPFTLLFGFLGFVGLFVAFRADRAIFAYLVTLTGTLTVGLVVYLNFRYGFSLAPEVVDRLQHEVRERDYFYIAGFLVWGVLAGMGLSWVWHRIAGWTNGARRYAAATPILLLATIPLILNISWASRAGDYAARDWAHALLSSVEPYGVLFTNGDNDTFPLWYLQEVEGIRKDVTVVVGEYLRTDWYLGQLQDLTAPERQRPWAPTDALAAEMYGEAGMPSRSISALTRAQMDGVGTVRLSEDLTMNFPGIAVQYPADMVLDRRQQLALTIIRDVLPERPVYFASAGGLMAELGLDRWGVRQGLAVKLEMRVLGGEAERGWVQGNPTYGSVWFDLDRSLTLYDDVYESRSIKDRPIWQDRSTLNIPWQYYALALQLADVAEISGRDASMVERLQDDALNYQVVAQGGARGTPGEIR